MPESGEVTRSPCVTEACRCNCGYRCGGPGKCKLDVMECLQQEKGHFERDCDHDVKGPMVDFGLGSSVSCTKCDTLAINHDCMVGP